MERLSFGSHGASVKHNSHPVYVGLGRDANAGLHRKSGISQIGSCGPIVDVMSIGTRGGVQMDFLGMGGIQNAFSLGHLPWIAAGYDQQFAFTHFVFVLPDMVSMHAPTSHGTEEPAHNRPSHSRCQGTSQ